MPAKPFRARDKVAPIAARAEGRPAAWIDDAHTPEAHDWAAGRGWPTLLVRADPAIGLTREHVDLLLAWVSAATHAPGRARATAGGPPPGARGSDGPHPDEPGTSGI